MTHDRSQQIKEAFLRLNVADPAGRERILAAESKRDPELWRRAESLVRATKQIPADFLEPPLEIVEAAARARARSRQLPELGGRELEGHGFGESPDDGIPGMTIGRYELVRPLGEGGFGVVWEAEQREPIHRLVAIKLIKRGMDTKQVIARFAAERQALAAMDHPSICKVLDAGSTEDGRPYFVMELVIGQPITDFARTQSLASRLRLFERVCRAIHHAHQRGIVHRDIKASNILVTTCDDEATPRVIDFGIAKAVAASGEVLPALTLQRQLVGTPQYMAPEQLESGGSVVDAKSDIYALGVLLYELLTGSNPWLVGDSSDAGYDSIARRIRELHPLKPSRRTSSFEKLSADLDWITLKCLEKEKARRYDSAAALAEDVRRHLDDEPVQAGPPDLSYRLRKFYRRHRLAVTSAALLTLLLFAVTLFGFFWTTWKNHQLDASNAKLRLKNTEYLREKANSERALQEVERLSDAHLLARLVARADRDLWPAVPEKIAAMKAWLTEAEELLGRADSHRSELRALRARALPPEPNHAGVDSVSFAATKDAWRYDLLSKLIRDLDALGAETSAAASVRKRLAFARDLRARSIEQHSDAWRRTIDRVVRGGRYTTLAENGFEPQVGLVPLGPDPDSGLLEFLDLATHVGPIPKRDSEGRISTTDNTGIVLVLIPGGSFFMGAQKDDEDAPNYDMLAMRDESPVHELRVEAFFMSKYEMTQAQWMHLENGANPSSYYQGVLADGQRFTRRHPVERVQWSEGERVLRKVGMTYPSEAQWEYATRAGTQTPWFFGDGGARIAEVANFADDSVTRAAFRVTNLNDGFRYTAPVGSFEANPFGLHDVCGNVAEWCKDPYRANYNSTRPLREPLGGKALRSWRRRVARGGAWSSLPDKVRSAYRTNYSGTKINHTLGLRPARAIQRKGR